MGKRPDPHPVDPRHRGSTRPDKPGDYERGRRDGDQRRQQGGKK